MAKTSRFERKSARQTLYIILAVLLCFAGPTYFVAVASRIIPELYAMALGFVCFVIGVFFIFQLTKNEP